TVSNLVPGAYTIPTSLQQLVTGVESTWPWSMLQSQFDDFLMYGLPTPPTNYIPLAVVDYTAVLKQTLQAYFGVGIGNFGYSIGQQLTFGAGATAGAGGAWYPTPQFAGLGLAGLGGTHPLASAIQPMSAISANLASSGKIGSLSVPAGWSGPPPGAVEDSVAKAITVDYATEAHGPDTS